MAQLKAVIADELGIAANEQVLMRLTKFDANPTVDIGCH